MSTVDILIGAAIASPLILDALSPADPGVDVPREYSQGMRDAMNAVPSRPFGADVTAARDMSAVFISCRKAIENTRGRGVFYDIRGRRLECARLTGDDQFELCRILMQAGRKGGWSYTANADFGRQMEVCARWSVQGTAFGPRAVPYPCSAIADCAKLATEIDALGNGFLFPERSILGSLGESAGNLPATIGGAIENVGGYAAGGIARLAAGVLFSTPVMIGILSYGVYRYAR
jgi:hypothetical protein